jgi:predicted Ser/Thr protein kinase
VVVLLCYLSLQIPIADADVFYGITMTDSKILKKDLFGEIRLQTHGGEQVIVRDARQAATGLRWLARLLLRREAKILALLAGIEGIAEVVGIRRDQLMRSYIGGSPMQKSRPSDPEFFRAAAGLRRKLRRAGVVHNDLAKEPNILVRADGSPAFIDFQMAWHSSARGKLFRVAAREDMRHLLKHKRYYCPDFLTDRERAILDTPSLAARIWRNTGKPIYLFVTRRILGWADREGAGDRGEQA